MISDSELLSLGFVKLPDETNGVVWEAISEDAHGDKSPVFFYEQIGHLIDNERSIKIESLAQLRVICSAFGICDAPINQPIE